MLSKKNRLNLSAFKVDKDAKKVSSEYFLISLNKKENTLRAGVVVSKKVASRAVDRNRIKRIVTESLKGQSSMEGDIRIIVRKNISNLKMTEVKTLIEMLLQKLK